MTTHASDLGHDATGAGIGLSVVRYLDVVVLVLALPLFLLADLPLLGYAVAAAAWIVQRTINVLVTKRADATDDPRAVVGMLAGSMIGRGWLVAGAILAVGLLAEREDGLAAAVLTFVLVTAYFIGLGISKLLEPERQQPAAGVTT